MPAEEHAMSDTRTQDPSTASKPPRKPRRSVKTTKRPASSETAHHDAAANPAGVSLSAIDRGAMIATAAYFRAQRRNFATGHELEDWLSAESEIDAALLGELKDAMTR
jgi:hypothetical protein